MGLKIENLTKTYGDFKALNHVSLEAENGKILGILGRNGAGKTTTIKSIMGIIEPEEGSITFDGIDIRKAKVSIGYLPEERGLYVNAVVKDQLLYFAMLNGMDKKAAFTEIKKLLEEFKIPAYDEVKHKGLVRHVLLRYGFKTDEIMVCLVINGKTIPHCHDLVGRLRQIPGMTSITLSTNTAKTNVIMGDTIRLLWGQEFITDYIGEIKYQISPLSFYQVNPVQTEKLYGLALDYAGLTGNEAVWDLYCGIGTISLFLAKKAKQVYGVEIVPQAIDDAKNNAKINDITNAEFYVGKAEEVLPEYYKEYEKTHNGETAHADVIVVDPPRKGCEESLLQTIVDMQPEKVVYVSCDSATLARDVKFLRANGYELKDVTPVDQFPHTVHVEVVCCLHRVNS